VFDVFALDAMTEMLASPLLFLSYLRQRALYSDKLSAGHEQTILAYHLKKNLWLDDKYDRVVLDDDIGVELDIAMGARRNGLPGKKTPEGILTELPSTTLGRMVAKIERRSDPATIDLGMVLLTLSGDAIRKASEGVDKIVALAKRDGKQHDVSGSIGDGEVGLTVHCSDEPLERRAPRLEMHCARRKYIERAAKWFGVCVGADGDVRCGVNLEFAWSYDPAMERWIEEEASPAPTAGTRGPRVGRNDPCPCGSGRKYKKCCLESEGR
jgi:hypothetical protein